MFDLIMSVLRVLGIVKNYVSATDPVPDEHIGSRAVIHSPFMQDNKAGKYIGKVVYKGAFWIAESQERGVVSLTKGEEVKIIGQRGIRFIVELVDK